MYQVQLQRLHCCYISKSKMEYLIGKRIGVRKRKQRVHKPRTTYLSLTEEECLQKLHLPRQVVTEVCYLLADDLSSKAASTPYSIPVAVRVIAALHFFATGSKQSPLGCIGGISQSAVSAAINAVSQGLVRHAAKFIQFPNTAESQAQVKKEFMDKFGFPGVLGVIDCTHVELRAPIKNAAMFVNKTGSHSINIQIICDASGKITNVFANYPASVLDSTILDNSAVRTVFQKDKPVEGWLLGDTAYPLRTWLLTPYDNPKTKAKLAYNKKHSETFHVIERVVVLLKTRFTCLNKRIGTLQYSPQKVGAFFVASCVLHNIALRHECPMEIDKDTIKCVRKLDAAMHQSLPVDLKTPAVAHQKRAKLAKELF